MVTQKKIEIFTLELTVTKNEKWRDKHGEVFL